MTTQNTAKETLKNTSLVGGAQVITILIGIVKTKVIALLLGPSGLGLIQLFTSTIILINSVFGLGLGLSGVRSVSESVGIGDKVMLSKTVLTLQRWAWVSGVVGILVTMLFSKSISQWTFGHADYWVEISSLSICILLTNLSISNNATIKGTRKMIDYVKINVLTAFTGMLTSVSFYYVLGTEGIVPSLILTGLFGVLISKLFVRKIDIPRIKIAWKHSFFSGKNMIKLGLFTVFTGFISQLTLYYVRIHISEKMGVDFVGYFTVAITLTVSYMGLIFTSLGADYLPKLSAIHKDDKAINIAVLEQTKIMLLLGTPLIIGMFTFSKYIISVLYSSEFILALPLLRWMLLSVFLRLIGFPIGYVFLAKSKGNVYMITQSLWNIVFLCLALLLMNYGVNLESIGIAYLVAYCAVVVANFTILNGMTNFFYDKNVLLYALIFALITGLYFILSYQFESIYILSFKIIVSVLLMVFCFRKLQKMANISLVELLKEKLNIK